MRNRIRIRKIFALITALAITVTALASCSVISDTLGFIQDVISDGGVRQLGDFNDLTYEKPDFAAIDDDIAALKSDLSDGGKTKSYYVDRLEDIVEKYYYNALTMENLAFLRYCGDITDSALRDEYYTLVSESEATAARLDELYRVCAASEYKSDFENELFGAGFFDSYTDDRGDLPPEYTALREKEAALMSEYSAAMADMSVEYGGKTYSAADISAVADDELYYKLVDAYYAKYNPQLADIYVRLVSVRNEIAAVLGYGSCTDYSFVSYSREYTGSDLEAYFAGIKKHIVPLYRRITDSFMSDAVSFPPASGDRIRQLGRELAGKMSSRLGRIFGSMEKKHLCSVNSSDKMYYGSFQVYLNSCDSPYIFINGEGSEYDVLTLMHEFGHFTSAYFNFGSTGSTDEAEVASSALELLTLKYADRVFDSQTAAALGKSEILSITSSLVECAAYTEFENRVYSDPSLTVEKCNNYFREIAEEYGISGNGGGYLSWVMVNHLFEYPYYVAGYSVSADVALQLFESCDGSIDPYLDFIKLANTGSFLGNISTAGLESPFADGRAEKSAAVISSLTEKYFS